MTPKAVTPTRFLRVLEAWHGKADVHVPRIGPDGEAAFVPWERGRAPALGTANVVVPPKAFLVPPRETVAVVEGGERREIPVPGRPVVVFGIRPCDAAAVGALDEAFLHGDPPDPRYARRRSLTTFVALACLRPAATCFCSSVGGGPGKPHAADILAVPLAGELLLTPHTDKGRRLLDAAGDLLADARPAALGQADAAIRTAEERLWPVRFNEIDPGAAADAALWDDLGRLCLGCRICSALCPAHPGLSRRDEIRHGRLEQVRLWGGRSVPEAEAPATGRPATNSRADHWRHRILQRFPRPGDGPRGPTCVGCGRCVRRCPAGLDLRTVLRRIAGS